MEAQIKSTGPAKTYQQQPMAQQQQQAPTQSAASSFDLMDIKPVNIN